MQVNRNYEREISLRDMFFHILYRWRSILAVALAGAVLLGGYAWFSNRKSAGKNAAAVQAEEGVEQAGSLQSNYEGSNRLYQSLLDDNRKYRDGSVVMNVDPYRVWKATVVYAVVVDDADIGEGITYNPAVPIALTYPSLVLDGFDTEKLGGICGADPEYISEIVSAASFSGSSSFSVTVIGTTREAAEKGRDYLEETVKNVSQGNVQQMKKHRVVEVSRYTRQAVDADVETRQANIAKNIATYQGAITTNETSIGKAPSDKKSGGKVSKKSKVRFAVIGAAAGALLLVCFYVVAYLLSGKLRSARELTERFGVPVYGEMNHSRARRPGKGVDRLIEKWEFRKNSADEAALVGSLGALIREQGEDSRVLLTGTIPAERMKKLADSLAEQLGDPARILVEGSFLNNGRAVAAASEATAVIVAAEKHVSETDEVRRMLEVLALGKTPVTGAVVM